MAMIIRLDRTPEAAQVEAIADDGCRQESAEIILFPGVRYERWSEKAPQSAIATEMGGEYARVQFQRDWLDI